MGEFWWQFSLLGFKYQTPLQGKQNIRLDKQFDNPFKCAECPDRRLRFEDLQITNRDKNRS